MKLLKHNEIHELGNGWGFYIDTDMEHNSYSYVKYTSMNIIPEINDIHTKNINNHDDNIHNIHNHDDKNKKEIDEKFVDIEIISVISLTFTCLFALLIH
jgi:hypothetical protein